MFCELLLREIERFAAPFQPSNLFCCSADIRKILADAQSTIKELFTLFGENCSTFWVIGRGIQ